VNVFLNTFIIRTVSSCDLSTVIYVQAREDGHEEQAGQPLRHWPPDSCQRGRQVGQLIIHLIIKSPDGLAWPNQFTPKIFLQHVKRQTIFIQSINQHFKCSFNKYFAM
jgi:hypothetical protein